LVGQPDCTQLRRRNTRFAHGFLHDGQLGLPNLVGIVLNPARLWKVLFKLALCDGHRLAGSVEHHRTRTGGALVN
jgi:hypothetical protein